MKAEVKKIDGIKREIHVEVEGDVVKNKFNDVFNKFAQEAKIPGFRPGKAPKELVEKHYSSHIHEQVVNELIPDIYGQVVKEHNLDALELPKITDVKIDRQRLSFKATVEVSPEIKIKNYKGLKVHYKKISVLPEEIKRNLDTIKGTRKAEHIDDNLVKGMGYPAVADLEKALEAQIFVQKENNERQRIENELVEALSKDLNFQLPQSLVDRQVQDLMRQAKVNLALRGMPREEIEKQEAAFLKEIEPEAKRQVKVYLILAEIAKKENIALDNDMARKVMELLLRDAVWEETK